MVFLVECYGAARNLTTVPQLTEQAAHDQAVLDFTKAIELSPNLAEAYYNRALIYSSKQKYAEALADIEMAQEFGYPVDSRLFVDLINKTSGIGR